jgi:hypothetical protein
MRAFLARNGTSSNLFLQHDKNVMQAIERQGFLHSVTLHKCNVAGGMTGLSVICSDDKNCHARRAVTALSCAMRGVLPRRVRTIAQPRAKEGIAVSASRGGRQTQRQKEFENLRSRALRTRCIRDAEPVHMRPGRRHRLVRSHPESQLDGLPVEARRQVDH